jgi:hypothetical protein
MDLSDLSVGRFVGFTGISWGLAREAETTGTTRGKHLYMIRWEGGRAIRVATNGVGGNLVRAF